MRLGSVITFDLALRIFLRTTQAGSLSAADSVTINKVTSVISQLHTRGGPDFVTGLDKNGATWLLEALLGVSLRNLRRGYKCNLKCAGDFVKTLSAAELANIQACIVFTNVLDQFGKNVNKIPKACWNEYIAKLGKGKRRATTVGSIPVAWAKKKSIKLLIEAIVRNGKDAIAAISPQLMERFVKNGWHSYFPLYSLGHLSGPNKAILTPQWLEATATSRNADPNSESLSKVLDGYSLDKALTQRLLILGTLLDITEHFPPNIGTAVYLEALLAVTSINLVHFAKFYNDYDQQWTRIFSVENALLRNRETRYEDRCKDVDFICSCLSGYREVGVFLGSTMWYIQRLPDDQVTALGKLLHAIIHTNQEVAKLRHHIRRVLTPKHHTIQHPVSKLLCAPGAPPYQSRDASGQMPLDSREKCIHNNFRGLIDEFLHSVLSTFKLFEGFLFLLSEKDLQYTGYTILSRLLVQILSPFIDWGVCELHHAIRDNALEDQRMILLAHAELIVKFNDAAFKIRTMFFDASSRLPKAYYSGDPFTSPNLTTIVKFVFSRVVLVKPAHIQHYSNIKFADILQVLSSSPSMDHLGEWAAQAHTCLRYGCDNPTFDLGRVKRRMAKIAKSVTKLVEVIDEIEDNSLRLCCLADLSTRLYQLAFDIEGFWSAVEDSEGAVYLNVSKFGLGEARVKSAGNINKPANGSEECSPAEFNPTSPTEAQAPPFEEEPKQNALPLGMFS